MAEEQHPTSAWLAWAERAHAERLLYIQCCKDYGTAVSRSLFLLNGGAIVALLGLTGSLFGRSDTLGAHLVHGERRAMIYFFAGLCVAAVLAAVGYVNFFFLADVAGRPGQLYELQTQPHKERTKSWQTKVINHTVVLGVVLALTSFALFTAGAWSFYRALESLH